MQNAQGMHNLFAIEIIHTLLPNNPIDSTTHRSSATSGPMPAATAKDSGFNALATRVLMTPPKTLDPPWRTSSNLLASPSV